MKVSIIITSYNYERFVAEAIESALNQTYENTEVVVVDDGSTDSSPEIIRRYEGRAKLVFQKNAGQPAACSAGFTHATGDLVFFLDSDDLLEKEAVETVVCLWRPEYSKMHFPLVVVDENGRRSGAVVPRATLPSGRLDEQILNRGLYVSPPASGNCYSREFLSQVLPIDSERWQVIADAYLIFLAPFYGEIGAIDEPLGRYRRHGKSVTSMTGGGKVDLEKKLGGLLVASRNVAKLIDATARARGRRLSPDAACGHWLDLKMILALSRLRPDREDPHSVATSLLRSVWSTSELGIAAKTQFTVWTLLVANLPARMALPLIQAAFAPGERIAPIRKLVWSTR